MKEGPREQQLRDMREANYARKRKGPDSPKTSQELDVALAALLPVAKSSDGAQDAHQSHTTRGARKTKRPVMDVGVAPGPSEANSGAPQLRREPVQMKSTQPTGSPNIKRGRPKKGEIRFKPWEAVGISKAQWYRRQKK